jgi:hypothetical protein
MKLLWMMILLVSAVLQAGQGGQELRLVEKQLRQEMPLASCGIEVAYRDDAVVLEGIVTTLQEKRLAFETAAHVSERTVRNELMIGDPHLADAF